MSRVIPVDLTKTGGRLLPVGGHAGQLPPAPEPPTKTAQPEQPVEKEAEKPTAHCKTCGCDPQTDPIKPNTDDLLSFQRAVLTGTPFTKTFELFGGLVKTQIRTLSAEEDLTIRSKVLAETATGKFPDGPAGTVAVYDRLTDLRMGMAVESLAVGGKVYTAGGEPEQRIEALLKACGTDVVYQALRQAHNVVAGLEAVILRNATNPSFFPAIGPGGLSSGSPTKA